MTNLDIKDAYEFNEELFEDGAENECVEYTADQAGVSVARVEKAIGWR